MVRDLRKDEPYLAYKDLQGAFKVVCGTGGDCFNRYLVRMDEMLESLRIVEQALENLPAGPVNVPMADRLVLPDKSRVYNIRDVTLDRSAFHITFDDGTIAFTEDVAGRITGAFFEGEGEVICTETPAGEVAMTTHSGSYAKLAAAHAAINSWRAATGRAFGASSWEIYGDWHDDEAKLETQVAYLLS